MKPPIITHASAKADVDILSAFEARAGAHAAYLALPDDDEAAPVDLAGTVAEVGGRLLAEIDDAEEVMRSAMAATLRGVECQLWAAISHAFDGREDDARSYAADLRYFEEREADLDWPTRLMLSAIKSLRAMGGRHAL